MKITNTQYTVTYGRTESGDDLPVLMWDGDPPADMVDEAYRKLLPYEFEEVGFVNWNAAPLEKAAP